MVFEGFSIAPHLLFTNYFNLSETLHELYYYLTTTTKKASTLSLYLFFLRNYFSLENNVLIE